MDVETSILGPCPQTCSPNMQDKHGLAKDHLGRDQWVSDTRYQVFPHVLRVRFPAPYLNPRRMAFRLVSYTPLDRLPYNLQDSQSPSAVQVASQSGKPPGQRLWPASPASGIGRPWRARWPGQPPAGTHVDFVWAKRCHGIQQKRPTGCTHGPRDMELGYLG